VRTTVVEVGDLLSVQGALGVEKQVRRLPGVERVATVIRAGMISERSGRVRGVGRRIACH
jgi:hypothetical protein